MRSPLAYAPRRGPLDDADALAATIYLTSFALIAFVYSNPIVLAGDLAAVVVAGSAAGAGRALRLAARWGLALGVVFVLVNAIVSQRGDTILLRGFDAPVLGHLDVTGEALLEGAVLALRVVVVMMAFAVHSARVDPDRLLRLLRPVAGRSALTATLIARMVPLAAADHGPPARGGGACADPAPPRWVAAAMARRLVAGSLDRAVDVAATLELRGYALGGAARRAGRRSSRTAAASATGLASLASSRIAAVALRGGVGAFDPYPTLAHRRRRGDVGARPLAARAGRASVPGPGTIP